MKALSFLPCLKKAARIIPAKNGNGQYKLDKNGHLIVDHDLHGHDGELPYGIKEGNESVTNCHALKMQVADGKMRFTDVADTEQLLRLIQSIPSPKAEPFKLWLAKVGYERIEETEDPELAFERGLPT